MTEIIAARFFDVELEKERVVKTSESSVTGKTTNLTRKTYITSYGVHYSIAGDVTDETAFKSRAEKFIKEAASLDDIYKLFNEKFVRSFKGKDIEVIFTHHKDSRILYYNPPGEDDSRCQLRWEEYALLGSGGELILDDFVVVYENEDWRDVLPTKEQIIELILDSYCKGATAKPGEVKLPIDVYFTNPYEYSKIKKSDQIWLDTLARVADKMKLKGINLESLVLETREFEKPPTPRKADVPKDKKTKKSKSGSPVEH